MRRLSLSEWRARVEEVHKHRYRVIKLLAGAGKHQALLRCTIHKNEHVGSVAVLVKGGNTCKACKAEQFRATRLANSLNRVQTQLEDKFGTRVQYVRAFDGMKTAAVFSCCTHGEFQAKPQDVLRYKYPCPACGRQGASDSHRESGRRRFLDATKRYENGFKFGTYKSSYTPVRVLCKTHNIEFEILPNAVLGRMLKQTWCGCHQCLSDRRKEMFTKTQEEVVSQLQSLHRGKVRLLGEYAGTREQHSFRCADCGHVWSTSVDSLVRTHHSGCPACAGTVSNAERELFDWVVALCPDAQQSVREVYSEKLGYRFEWDVYIPSKKIAIEYNGLYFHRYPVKPKDYHWEKTRKSAAHGVKLVHVYEDDWLHRRPVVCKTLKHLLGVVDERFFARKLVLKSKDRLSPALQSFYEKNHMLGAPIGGVTYGLLDSGKIRALMTFKPVQSERGKGDGYELIRFASRGQVVGGASRLFTAFLRDVRPNRVISYSDSDMFEGNLYSVLGFNKVRDVPPDYTSVWGGIRRHKSYTRRTNLARLLGEAFDPNKSEMQNLINAGVFVIFNSGRTKWEWKPS